MPKEGCDFREESHPPIEFFLFWKKPIEFVNRSVVNYDVFNMLLNNIFINLKKSQNYKHIYFKKTHTIVMIFVNKLFYFLKSIYYNL